MNRTYSQVNGIWVKPQYSPLETPFRRQLGAPFKIGRTVFAVFGCECGSTQVSRTDHVAGGRAPSCGCRSGESAVTHGHTRGGKTREYEIWSGMKKRCLNPRCEKYHLYGGRGVMICQRWIDSFESFLADMGPCPSNRHSIDRFPDRNGNYEPGNCRWATQTEQCNNSSQNVRIIIDGVDKTAAEWSEISGIKASIIRHRIHHGWEPVDAVWSQKTDPVSKAKVNAAKESVQ